MRRLLETTLAAALLTLVVPAAVAKERASYLEMQAVIAEAKTHGVRVRDRFEILYQERADDVKARGVQAQEAAAVMASSCDFAAYEQAMKDYRDELAREIQYEERGVKERRAEMEALDDKIGWLEVKVDKLEKEIHALAGQNRPIDIEANIKRDVLFDQYYPIKGEMVSLSERRVTLAEQVRFGKGHLALLDRQRFLEPPIYGKLECSREMRPEEFAPVPESPQVPVAECLATIGGSAEPPLCVVSKNIVHDPEDGDIADATWTLTHMDGTPARDGMEMPIHARLSFADGSPVGRGEMTYAGSKTEKGGLLIFHWDVSPDYRVVAKPASAEGSGAALTIEPQ